MIKYFRSSELNFLFDNTNGFTATWGRTRKEDALFSPYGPMIVDCEISTICHGVGNTGNGCTWCYKSSNKSGKNMSLETFKRLFDKMFVPTLTQISFGIGSIDSNPELFNIMEYCRNNDVIPNITINGERMTPRYYDLLSSLCGSAAVSLYNKDICYSAVQELTRRGMEQCNIHVLAADENYSICLQVIDDMKNDNRLQGVGAVVFLALKPKGKRNVYHKLSKQQFQIIVDTALDSNIKFGFDSCTSHNFLSAAKNRDNIDQLKMVVEPCESGLFSEFISVDAKLFPCSFSPGIGEWKEGLDILNCSDFIKDIWNHPKLVKYRNLSLFKNRECLLFDMALEEK